MNKYCTKVMTVCAVASLMMACSKDKDPVIVIPPSSGSTLTLNGIISTEAGSSAGNSVFVDFSADKQYPVARASWDLGFYGGSDFRVKINNTTAALGKLLAKNDLTKVGASDTIGLTLALSQGAPVASDFALFDNISQDITGTVIPAVSATDADNKVFILNRGTGGGRPASSWVKLRILRNGNTGYTLQYAGITETTFKTVSIAKDGNYNFKYLPLADGSAVTVEPEKTSWDIQWTYSAYHTSFDGVDVPYSFSDLVFINKMAGVQASEKIYSSLSVRDTAFKYFNKDSIAKTQMSNTVDVIGSNWRATIGASAGVKKDRFYVVKDAAANYYKVKFVSFITADGGTRGKPIITYELLK